MNRAHVLALTALLASCSAAPPAPAPAERARYDVGIRWTSYGVPHVKASDWGSLGYGLAYVVATDGLCTLAREFTVVRGEQSKFFGPDEGRREADVFHKAILTDAALAKAAERTPREMRELQAGYIAGYNRYLADHSGERLPESCRNQPWVRPIDAADLARLNLGVGIRYGVGRAQAAIANAAPPGAKVTRTDPSPSPAPSESVERLLGSNAIALGRQATVNGRGLLLGNPHYPWSGPSRFHMAHLTIPGELDVMGVGLLTTQFISIGFNRDIAWTHTVSTGLRSTLYELSLDPSDPLAYRYGGQTRKLTPRTTTIEVRQPDGRLATETHTIYDSHVGPIIEDQELAWTHERAYAIRDSNLDNNRAPEQYLKFARAKSVEELLDAMRTSQGLAWVNTVAADRHGKALYADLSVVPNVDEALIKRCSTDLKSWREEPTLVLRASPECEWRDDPRAQQRGILPPQQSPWLIREDFVSNSNDSYWASNPGAPLEGFSPIIGSERTARSLRTRAGLVMIGEVLNAEANNKFDAERLQELLLNHRNYGAELALDDVLAICGRESRRVVLKDATVDVSQACAVLASWDRRQDLDSRGAQIWTEFWRLAEKTPNLWRTGFDAHDPVNTPRDLNRDDPAVRAAVMQALGAAVARLEQARIPLDAPWGQVQYVERNGERIGIPGGLGSTGMFSMIVSKLAPEKGYTPVTTGNSWIQVVTWDEHGQVDARGLLTYSQSEEISSPHSADQTKLYSRGELLRLPFSEDTIAADPQLRSLHLRGD